MLSVHSLTYVHAFAVYVHASWNRHTVTLSLLTTLMHARHIIVKRRREKTKLFRDANEMISQSHVCIHFDTRSSSSSSLPSLIRNIDSSNIVAYSRHVIHLTRSAECQKGWKMFIDWKFKMKTQNCLLLRQSFIDHKWMRRQKCIWQPQLNRLFELFLRSNRLWLTQ